MQLASRLYKLSGCLSKAQTMSLTTKVLFRPSVRPYEIVDDVC